MRHKDYVVRTRAATILQTIGAPAIPALIEALRDPFSRDRVMLLLRDIGNMQALINALPTQRANVQRFLRVIIQDNFEAALPVLKAALASDDHTQALTAITCLGGIATETAQALLIEAVTHADDQIAARAIFALTENGVPNFIEKVLRTLQHHNEHIVTRTFTTLLHLEDAGGVVLVAAAMQDERDFVRVLGARAVPVLVRQGHLDYAQAVEILNIRMRDKSFNVGDSARVALEWLNQNQ